MLACVYRGQLYLCSVFETITAAIKCVHVFLWRLPGQSSSQGLKKSNHSLSDQQLLRSLSVRVITSRACDLIAVNCELPSTQEETATMLHCSATVHCKLLTDATRMAGMCVFIKIPPASILHSTNKVFLSPVCMYCINTVPVWTVFVLKLQPEIHFLNRSLFCPPIFSSFTHHIFSVLRLDQHTICLYTHAL